MANPGRNDPCPCGSGKKYKRCCLDKDAAAELKQERLAAAAAWRPVVDVDIVDSFVELDKPCSARQACPFNLRARG